MSVTPPGWVVANRSDPLRVHSARDEAQGVGRFRIDPLRVVHDAQHRTLLGKLREQAERRERDQEPVGALGGSQAERPLEGGRL